jgi:hypothetical protein
VETLLVDGFNGVFDLWEMWRILPLQEKEDPEDFDPELDGMIFVENLIDYYGANPGWIMITIDSTNKKLILQM